MNRHPLQGLVKETWLYRLLWVSVVGLTITLALLPLRPNIICFEFNALGVLPDWDASERLWAAFSLGLDFLYIVVYSTFFTLLCLRAAPKFQNSFWMNLGYVLAWGQWFAAVFDGLENGSLLAILLGYEYALLALAAKLFASLKFALIIAAALYAAVGYLFRRESTT
ncbi:hypothetical protein D0962_34000 [Leptolyngbyaceae cyanobacterium CCMR0082]|uniref:Uncharacterized protein n=1 Tax=Adonisia turfae CCMR0082 TaxID=2304604 RepID=A0A6M0SGM2_9CYAN|nr:hypothetical protein [Adonisia turfae]NEZ67718.1 hypothetical protein [Adonisia turfae CCMR0082]